MSARSGPRLAAIGRSGDSDLVLCMDAHDAGSYGGEQTTNLFPQPSLADSAVGSTWTGNGGTWGYSTATVESVMGPDGKYIKAVALQHTASGGGTAHIWFFYSSLSGMGSAQRNLTLTNGTAYTCSWWWKAVNSRTASSNNIYFTSPNYSTGASNTVTTEWTKAYVSFTYGNATATLNPGHYFYSCGDDFKVWYAMLQIEEKTYATPAVRSQLSGFSQQGYNARPASNNLMIHGNVGTGTSFKDSSPSKHVITNYSSNMTHSNTQSKFPGGAIYGANASDNYLQVADSTDFDFGTSTDFTVDYWMYHSGTITSWDCMFEIGNINNNGVGNFLNTDGRIRTHVTTAVYDSAGGVITENTWYHIAVVRSGAIWTTYVNGVSVATTTRGSDTIGQYTEAFHIHNGVHTTGYGWNGYIDEFRVTKGTALWTHPFTPPTRRNLSAPLVDLSGNYSGGNFATTDSTDVKTNRRGQVIEPIANAYWNFDGTDDTISLGGTTAAASARPLNAYPFTFTAWVISDTGWSPVSGQDELLNMNIAGQRVSLGIMNNSGWGAYGPSIMYGGTNHWSCPASAFGSPTGWTHIAYVIYGSNNSNHKIYINGIPQVLTNNGGAHGGTAGWTLGSNGASGEYWFGNIANVQLYNKALSAAEVRQNVNAQGPRFETGIPTIVRSGLMLRLDGATYSGSGSTWYDSSGNNYDITLVGSPTWNSAGYFDFNGSSQFGYHTFASAIGTQTAVTTEVWVNADTISGWDSMFDMHNDDYLVALLNGQLAFYDPTHYSGYTVSVGTWYQLVVAYNSAGTSYFYANGASVGSFTGTVTKAPTIVSVAAGYSSPSTGNEYFDGQMAILNWYNRQLTAAEIGQNFRVQRERFGI